VANSAVLVHPLHNLLISRSFSGLDSPRLHQTSPRCCLSAEGLSKADLADPNFQIPMKYAYLIQSIPFPNQRSIGITSGVDQRLAAHNEGRAPHTAKFKTWELITCVAFSNHEKAREFERYLKSGSGRAFVKKRFRGQLDLTT
jgi:predicted GIY-YIG superfamily endonuclease